MLELVAEDELAVAAEPVVEQRGVEAAEVGVIAEVAVVVVLDAGVSVD